MVCLFHLISPPLQFGLQDWISIWSGNEAPCGVWTYGEGDSRQVSFPCLVTLVYWIPHLCLVTPDLSGYTLSSSIYVRLMAVWGLHSGWRNLLQPQKLTPGLHACFNWFPRFHYGLTFLEETFKYADYIWVVHWFALLEVLLQDCRVG